MLKYCEYVAILCHFYCEVSTSVDKKKQMCWSPSEDVPWMILPADFQPFWLQNHLCRKDQTGSKQGYSHPHQETPPADTNITLDQHSFKIMLLVSVRGRIINYFRMLLEARKWLSWQAPALKMNCHSGFQKTRKQQTWQTFCRLEPPTFVWEPPS